jgi:Ca2+-binding RTX toxin-like protein
VNIASPDVDGTDFFDGGEGDDYIVDFHAGAISVEPVPAANAILQLDGGPGFDTISPDFGNQTAAIIWTDAAPTNLEFANGAFARNFERTRYFGSGAGDDSIAQSGRVDNWIYTRGGDDTIAPGLGLDNVNGGAGNDLVVLDYSILDLPEYTGLLRGGGGTTISTRRDHPGAPVLIVDSIFAVNVERMHLSATSKDDAINDLAGDDVILTGAGNDNVICGSGGNNYVDLGEGDDIITGASAFAAGLTADDTILGGPGNDTIDAGNGDDTVDGGPGDDVIRGDVQGVRFGGRDTFDGGEGDDLIDQWLGQVSDSTYTTPGTRLQLDGGPGFDTLFADFGYATEAISARTTATRCRTPRGSRAYSRRPAARSSPTTTSCSSPATCPRTRTATS